MAGPTLLDPFALQLEPRPVAPGFDFLAPVDPSLGALVPPRRTATGPDALALNDPPAVVMPGARITPATQVPTGLAAIGTAPPVPTPDQEMLAAMDRAAQRIGVGLEEAKARQSQREWEAKRDALANQAGIYNPDKPPPASASPGTGAPISPVRPAGGAAVRPAAPAGVPMGRAAQEYSNFIDSEIINESRKPVGGGPVRVQKGGKIQTSEQTQGIIGPNADTQARLDAIAEQLGKEKAIVGEADAALVQKKAEIDAKAAEAEQQAAETKAAIQQRAGEALGQIGGQMRDLQGRIASAEIDPTRWWTQKSTADKVGIGIAMALGGLTRGLTGRTSEGDPILKGVFSAMDRDVDAQIKNIDKQKGDLTDLQRIYAQTREQFGDEAIAADATKIAALQGLKAQLAQEAAKAQAVRGTEAVHDPKELQDLAEAEAALRAAFNGEASPLDQRAAEARLRALQSKTRSYDVRARIASLELERLELEKRAELETKINGSIARGYGFTQDKLVGGGGGRSSSKLESLYKKKNDIEDDQRKLSVSEREKKEKETPRLDSFTVLDKDGKERVIEFDADVPPDVRVQVAKDSNAQNAALRNAKDIKEGRGDLFGLGLGIPWKRWVNKGELEGSAHSFQLNYDAGMGQGQSNEGVIKATKERATDLRGGSEFEQKAKDIQQRQIENARQYGKKK